jgi:hypothetical protein
LNERLIIDCCKSFANGNTVIMTAPLRWKMAKSPREDLLVTFRDAGGAVIHEFVRQLARLCAVSLWAILLKWTMAARER